jgi:hypothetical protein
MPYPEPRLFTTEEIDRISRRAAEIYLDVREFCVGEFEQIFGCLTMVMATAIIDLVENNPELPEIMAESIINARVAELVAKMRPDWALATRKAVH